MHSQVQAELDQRLRTRDFMRISYVGQVGSCGPIEGYANPYILEYNRDTRGLDGRKPIYMSCDPYIYVTRGVLMARKPAQIW